jgi:hypothetical protein
MIAKVVAEIIPLAVSQNRQLAIANRQFFMGD